MTHVATLITNPAEPALDDATLRCAQAALPGAGDVKWLDPRVAADIPFTPVAGFDQRRLAGLIRAELSSRPVDVVVQAASHRRKRLFLADMDSTMIGQECIDELADHAGFKTQVAAITERAMRGEIVFEPALRARVALLKGLPGSVVDEVIAKRIVLTPGGRPLIATMRANGAYTCLVSGGFTLFTNRIAGMIGFDENRANTLLVDATGRFSGYVGEPILGSEAKLSTLNELRGRFRLEPEDTLAAGDGANDIPMIQAAGLGIAYHAKPAVAQAAAARIDHGDLTALLYAQGYARGEFAAP
ncbi:MAG: phosphoserine phosphatase SerB [Hyphomicrobiales bacterium]|nr:phosphoserine phosphatase SerB [Alphaproteobacteria bacterium]